MGEVDGVTEDGHGHGVRVGRLLLGHDECGNGGKPEDSSVCSVQRRGFESVFQVS